MPRRFRKLIRIEPAELEPPTVARKRKKKHTLNLISIFSDFTIKSSNP